MLGAIGPASLWTTSIAAICDEFGGEVQTGPFGSQLHASDYSETGTPVVMPQDMADGKVVCDRIARVADEHVKRLPRHVLRCGDIVFSRRGDVGRFAVISERESGWLCGTGSLRIRLNCPRISVDYARHYLQQPLVGAWLAHQAKGVTMPNLNTEILRALPFICPPISEQRRIAAILDEADALRAKRRAALAQLDEMARAIFVEMFGDIKANTRGWPTIKFGEALAIPLRNGVSPATDGTVSLDVLTLSAVTGGRFKATARKAGMFTQEVPPEKRVSVSDLLICRGNGNPALVGRGFFPSEDMSEVVFPDTIIAARIDQGVIVRGFLQVVWNSDAVRHQIESRARTTNGTFKVNQRALESVEIPVPPISAQRVFEGRVEELARLAETVSQHAEALDSLFASLQHRAFRGEL